MKEVLLRHVPAAGVVSPLSKPRRHSLQKAPRSLLPLPHPSPNAKAPIATISPAKPLQFVLPGDPHLEFREKALFLESLGLDLLALVDSYPPLVSAAFPDVKATIDFLRSYGFSAADLRRICSMCPDILSSSPASILPVFTFLLREAGIEGSDLHRVVHRRPRLLVCDVQTRLRPTLCFLQMLGIKDVSKHTSLLSCSVEEKFVPRIEYLRRIGFSHRDTLSMFRRFPQLFCYSIKENFEPKFDYFVVEMGRDLKELKEFPQYFSFSLENRINPRHRLCVKKGVCFPLPIMLKTTDERFQSRLEISCSSSPPLRRSPLWSTADEAG